MTHNNVITTSHHHLPQFFFLFSCNLLTNMINQCIITTHPQSNASALHKISSVSLKTLQIMLWSVLTLHKYSYKTFTETVLLCYLQIMENMKVRSTIIDLTLTFRSTPTFFWRGCESATLPWPMTIEIQTLHNFPLPAACVAHSYCLLFSPRLSST